MQIISEKEARSIVLSQGNEDYSGLYEVIWRLNEVFPDVALGEKYGAAERAVSSLLHRGWISLYRCSGPLRSEEEECEEVDAASVEEVLSNPVSWYPEYGGIRIVFAATEAGERAYMSGILVEED